MKEFIIAHFDGFLGLVGAVITVALSGFISNVVTNKNIKNERENLNKQMDAELERIKQEYVYSQKLSNSNFLYKFKLEKLAELYELVGQYSRYNAKLTILIRRLFRGHKIEDITDQQKNTFVEDRTLIEDEFFNRNVMRQISIIVSYFPDLKDVWTNTTKQHNIIESYPDQILGLVNITNPEFFDRKIPEYYSRNDFEKDLDNVNLLNINLLTAIETEISTIMIEMEK